MSKGPKQARLGADEWEIWAHQATPLFRWAGGKRRFIQNHSHLLEKVEGTYHEPFAGSLAVYFWKAANSPMPLRASISDINLRLIRTYQEIKFDYLNVWESLTELIHGYGKTQDQATFYYKVREDFNANSPRGDAARFIFLMATGWNGVYRTNSAGKFNVPFGASPKSAKFPSESDLQVASLVLSYADIRSCSWETALSSVQTGDFVFLDPPYLSDSEGDSRIYEKVNAFTISDHERLANELVVLQERGVSFLLTNGRSETLLALYRDLGLNVEVVSALRSISRNTDERGHVAEIVVTPGANKSSKRQQIEDDFNLNMQLLRRRKEHD